MFEGIDWVLGGSFKSRIDSEDNTNNQSSEEGNSENLPADIGCEWGKGRKDKGENITENQAKYTTQDRENKRFEEKLHENVSR